MSVVATHPENDPEPSDPEKIRLIMKWTGLSLSRAARLVRTRSAFINDPHSDAPACNSCGAITVRSGTQYRCLNCGNTQPGARE